MEKFFLVVLVSLMLAACGGGSGGSSTPAVPPSVDVTGTWKGSSTESAFGSSIATFNAVQSGAAVTGTYSNIYGTGSVSATVSGDTMLFSISPTGCTGTLSGTGTVTTDTTTGQTKMATSFSGTYVCNGTTFNDSGTGNLIKQ
ncbi:hypothetical protein F6V30_10685 [Oryzomonas sagensis]|uniref:Lipocalin-like domain-containing protein n=1 Tax=Oryzomonas sagensis TaxID=2603857 RepID=A0ABQ6TPV0_9BACT|nr:hypothetical protein [Oryzomonas sagensis]KAB0670593.1 hypothetical protein F6V30_10685 [Oryzomonas sagensis]